MLRYGTLPGDTLYMALRGPAGESLLISDGGVSLVRVLSTSCFLDLLMKVALVPIFSFSRRDFLTCVVARGGAPVSKDDVIGLVAGHGEASSGEAGVGDFRLSLLNH